MISGGATSLQQEYSMPIYIGVLVISILVCFTVVLGLQKFIKIIGYITPVIIIAVIVVSIINVGQNFQNISQNVEAINNGSIEITRAGHY